MLRAIKPRPTTGAAVGLLTHALLACCFATTTGGCSLLFTETVPDNPHKLRYFDCTSTPGLAVADGVSAVSQSVAAVTTLLQSKEEFEEKNDGASRNLVAGISIGVAALAAASGIYGLVQSERCRGAKSELRDRLLAPERRETKLPSTSPFGTPQPGVSVPDPAKPAVRVAPPATSLPATPSTTATDPATPTAPSSAAAPTAPASSVRPSAAPAAVPASAPAAAPSPPANAGAPTTPGGAPTSKPVAPKPGGPAEPPLLEYRAPASAPAPQPGAAP